MESLKNDKHWNFKNEIIKPPNEKFHENIKQTITIENEKTKRERKYCTFKKIKKVRLKY